MLWLKCDSSHGICAYFTHLLWHRLISADVQVSEFSYVLSGASLYQDVPSRVTFSTSFVNVAAAGNDVAAADVSSSNFMVELVVSDADLSLSGQSDSLQIPPSWPHFIAEEATKLAAGTFLLPFLLILHNGRKFTDNHKNRFWIFTLYFKCKIIKKHFKSINGRHQS